MRLCRQSLLIIHCVHKRQHWTAIHILALSRRTLCQFQPRYSIPFLLMWSGVLLGVTTLITIHSRPTPPKFRRSLLPAAVKAPFDCYVLTTGVRSRQSLPFTCQYIIAEPFSPQQWRNVDPTSRDQMTMGLRYGFFDLTNNNTVNIFHNHAQIWKRVYLTNKSALILEDDATFIQNAADEIMQSIDSVSDVEFGVLKLHNLNSYQFNYLKPGETTCVCRNFFIPASTMAYYITPSAAKTLFASYIPIKTHVDLWIWQMACVERKIYLLSSRNIATETAVSSLHRTWLSGPFDSISWRILNGVSALQHSMIYLKSGFFNTSHCPSSYKKTRVNILSD